MYLQERHILARERYPRELRQGPNGQPYRWLESVDGVGNPVDVRKLIEETKQRAREAWRRLKEAIRAQLATMIFSNPNITLATVHVSGVNDNATARLNIMDTSNGSPASRSNYGNAPGGTVRLDNRLLMSILDLANTFNFSISEIVGGSHSPKSRHYHGVVLDVNVINGQHVSATHLDVARFMRRCGDLGATEVLGPGDPSHATHVHCAWPRP